MRSVITLAAAGCVLALGCGSQFTASGGGGSSTTTTSTSSGGGAGGAGGSAQGGSGAAAGGSGGEGGASEPCGPGGVASLVDDFQMNGLNTVLWRVDAMAGAHIDATNPHLAIGIDLSVPGVWRDGRIFSKATYRLTDCSMHIEVVEVTDSVDSHLWFAAESESAVGSIEIAVSYGNLIFYYDDGGGQVGSTPIPYNPTTHRWWRIREQDDTVYFETASAAGPWITHDTRPSTVNVDEVTVTVGAGSEAEGGGTALSKADNVNTKRLATEQ